MKIRRWINFARWTNRDNCVGKGKVLDCEYNVADESLMIDMTLDGVRFIGTLHQYKEEEEE